MTSTNTRRICEMHAFAGCNQSFNKNLATVGSKLGRDSLTIRKSIRYNDKSRQIAAQKYMIKKCDLGQHYVEV